MDSILNTALEQLPALVLFIIFLLQWQKSTQAANVRNHEMWIKWFDARDQSRHVEHTELITSLKEFQDQIERLTWVVLLSYPENDREKILEKSGMLERK